MNQWHLLVDYNRICHEWTMNDDPTEVHRRLAQQCPFVLSMPSVQCSPKIINDKLDEKFESSHREATFSNITWKENLPTIKNLVRAGFFYAGIDNAVACFYCNGSLSPHK
ncbi:unnamed protein product [Rotaria sp. Silwood2]|nr:unnamed protein product [Rotaria sp. Silwood2]CAF3037868.1 unnamed protein product [Rotaria sp. Silwood2]CAF3117536.1 unnamed protein product [Rotaria sp. Silwood2]CAF3146996.1 unnamed protein product [Rotaria sp. Silwood2]CAF4196585.1 unnamed protein product [Rotaria sp. Silwood2]